MTAILVNILLVALGGGFGGMARFWLSGVVGRRYGETFPWGTLVVNVSGAACIGVLGGQQCYGERDRSQQRNSHFSPRGG